MHGLWMLGSVAAVGFGICIAIGGCHLPSNDVFGWVVLFGGAAVTLAGLLSGYLCVIEEMGY